MEAVDFRIWKKKEKLPAKQQLLILLLAGILLVVVVTIITFAFALVFAAILTREKIKGQNFFRIISISRTSCLWSSSPVSSLHL